MFLLKILQKIDKKNYNKPQIQHLNEQIVFENVLYTCLTLENITKGLNL